MVGHSKWSKVKHIKGSLDVKRGAAFRKVVKEITVAARVGGGDLSGQPLLVPGRGNNPGPDFTERKNSALYDGTKHFHPNFDVSEVIYARLDA